MIVERRTPKQTLYNVNLLVIQATPFCNINCDYCYLPHRGSKQLISMDVIDNLFQKLFQSGLVNKKFTIVWHAGEPLVVPIAFYEQVFQRINELNTIKSEISHSIQTNGTLLDQKWCDFIKKYNVKIGVSLDGPEFIHDAHRKKRSGKGTHKDTMRGIAILNENKIEFHVISVITRSSLDYPNEIFNFFLENKIRNVGLNIEEIEGVNLSSTLQRESEQQYIAFIKRFYELSKKHFGLIRFREFQRFKALIFDKASISQGQQSTPFTIISIDCNGNFSTFSPELLGMKSPLYGDFVFGNVLESSFLQVLSTEKFRQINQDIQYGIEMCRKHCDYFSLCGGGAPSNKYFENQTFRSTETMHCRYTKQILSEIILGDLENSLL